MLRPIALLVVTMILLRTPLALAQELPSKPRCARSGQELLTLKGHTGPVRSVAFSPDGKRVASASVDQTVKVWDAATGQELLTLKGHTAEVRRVTFSHEGNRLASASGDQTVKVWNVTSGP